MTPVPSPTARAGRRRAGLVTTAALLLGLTVAVVAPGAPAGATTPTQAVTAAARYGSSRGYYVGVSVLDTKTGHVYGAGHHTATFASESVVKVMIAARLYVQGRLHGSTASRAYYMITHSDDNTASAFYGSVGGDSLINWVKSHYGVPDLGSPPRRAGWWGNTHITPDGMVKLYAKLKRTGFGPWLLNAMHHASKFGSDGFYQWFGLRSASSTAAIKQGWGTDYDNWSNGADENTTGFVNGDRFAVAILARGSAGTYGGPIGSMLTGMAKTLLPGGTFPGGVPVITGMKWTAGRTRGHGADVIYGSNLDATTKIYFGIHRVRVMKVLSSTAISVQTPAASAGSVGVRVVTTHGTSKAPGFRFTYIAPPTVTAVSPTAVRTGATLTVSGANYVGRSYGVHFISLATGRDTDVHPKAVGSSHTLTVVVPARLTGTIGIRVSTLYGTSSPSSAARITIVGPSPAVARAKPSSTPPSSGAPSSTPPSSTSSSAAGSAAPPSGSAAAPSGSSAPPAGGGPSTP